MHIPIEFVERLRENLDISNIISRRVKLVRKGKEYSGLCPFHNERTPSFTVNDQKQFYHCFGCGAHGDVLKFVMDTEGLDFIEAVKSLATIAGIAMPENYSSEYAASNHLSKFQNIMNLANKWFIDELHNPHGAEARKYLKNRNITEQIIKKFSIGFAPNGNLLKKFLADNNVLESQMIELGLVVKSDNGSLYDKFRARIIFPIFSKTGKIIGFGGRALGDEMPKYLNSPETILFKKNEILYNLNNAREIGYRKKRIIVVEGYMDAIAVDMAGFSEVVASMGTAMNENHIKDLWKITQEPIICFDGDNAGQNAMKRIADIALSLVKPGYSLRFAMLDQNLDPDDYIKKHGANAMGKLFDVSITLSTLLWQQEFNNLSKNPTPEDKALIEKNLFAIADKIQDSTLKNSYRNYFSNQIWENIKSRKSSVRISKTISRELLDMAELEINMIEKYEYILFSILLNHPILLHDHEIEEEFILFDLKNISLDGLRVIILEAKNLFLSNDINKEEFRKKIEILLEKSEYKYDLKYIYDGNPFFLMMENKFNDIKTFWICNVNKYRINLLKEEKQNALNLLTEQSMEKARILDSQILHLENNISNTISQLKIRRGEEVVKPVSLY